LRIDPDQRPDTQKPSKWVAAWAASTDDPYLFVVAVLGVKSPEWVRPELDTNTPQMSPWQAQVLKAIRDGHKRISIRSGHGTGKTALLSWLVLWGLLCHKDAKLPFGANSQNQLRDTVWPEIGKWSKRLPEELREQIEVLGERVVVKSDPEDSFAVARTCTKENSEALAGFHADFLMFLLDEASGIPDVVFEVAQGALSTEGAIMIMTGNPTRNSGYFHASHHKNRSMWWTARVNSEDVPRARGHIAQVAKEYGIESNQYRVRVLGEFPLEDDDTLLSLATVRAAVGREVAPMRVMPVWGVDPARFGRDRTTLCKRKGNVVLEPVKVWNNKDTMTIAGLVAREFEDTPVDERPHEICVDVIGVGAGVADRLEELGYPVRGINVAEAPSIGGLYNKLRDELWFKCKQWFEALDVAIPDDEDLISELVTVIYGFTSSGKIKIEGKEDMAKRGMRSPDLADALCLTFAGDDRARARLDRHRRSKASSYSAWSA